jgi:uncharacterized protein YjbI with pentapeptide repeats
MADMSDPRVPRVLSHAEECRVAEAEKSQIPLLPSDLKDLSDINLIGENLKTTNLIGADLTGAKLGGANLEDADLTDANLTGAVLTRTNLKGANLVLMTNATNDNEPRPHVLLQKEKDGNLRIKITSLVY